MTDFYTYIYHDGAVPIYVGKGTGNRAYTHLKKSHNEHLNRKLAKMKREGREPRIQIIEAPDEDAAYDMEELLVSMIGRVDLETGTLLNKDDGGKGASRPGPETRAKRSASIRSVLARPEVKERLSASVKAALARPEVKERQSNASKATSKLDHVKRAKSLVITAVNKSPAQIARVKERFNKPCTIDGITIYESVGALKRALGKGKAGRKNPNFQFIRNNGGMSD